jgi:mono/diheme cytochrome c family protein
MGYLAGRTVLAVALGVAFAASAAGQATKNATSMKAHDPVRERGRYVVTISGCNDCHTPNYALNGGKVDESQLLVGDSLGWRGAWGTTYPVNLRLYMQEFTENEWVAKAKHLQTRPPMPWFNVNQMSEADLRAVYRYIRSLTPVGSPAPAYVPPNQEPKPPYVTFPAPPK